MALRWSFQHPKALTCSKSSHRNLAYELKFGGLKAETSSVQSCKPIWHEQLCRLAKLFLEGRRINTCNFKMAAVSIMTSCALSFTFVAPWEDCHNQPKCFSPLSMCVRRNWKWIWESWSIPLLLISSSNTCLRNLLNTLFQFVAFGRWWRIGF